MRWHDLLFAHWPIPIEALRPLIPPELEIDTFDGTAWLGIVAFRMSQVGPVGLPTPPILGSFGEINVRTYVTHGGHRGVWFFSLDAASVLTVVGASTWFHLPYRLAGITCQADIDGSVAYRSRRAHPGLGPAGFRASYRPTGPIDPDCSRRIGVASSTAAISSTRPGPSNQPKRRSGARR